MTKKYKEFMEEASAYIAGAIMYPGVRRDLEYFLSRVSSVNHADMFLNSINERFAAHGLMIDYSPIGGVDLEDGGEAELEIYEVATKRLVDDGKTKLYLMWERFDRPHNPENNISARAKEYRVKAYLMTEVEEGALGVDSDDVTPDFESSK